MCSVASDSITIDKLGHGSGINCGMEHDKTVVLNEQSRGNQRCAYTFRVSLVYRR